MIPPEKTTLVKTSLIRDKTKEITPINFIVLRGPRHIYNNRKNAKTLIQKLEDDQKQFKSNLIEITRGNPQNKSKVQLNKIKNIRSLYNLRVKLSNYIMILLMIMSKSKYKPYTGLEIWTLKQMLQILLTALSQIKASNNSENLLNETIQIVYFLYQSRRITINVNNYIIKSIQI